MNENIIFVGTNLPNLLDVEISAKESLITNGMTDSELKAYKLGVFNTIELLKGICSGLDYNEFLIHLEHKTDEMEEFDIDALEKIVIGSY